MSVVFFLRIQNEYHSKGYDHITRMKEENDLIRSFFIQKTQRIKDLSYFRLTIM